MTGNCGRVRAAGAVLAAALASACLAACGTVAAGGADSDGVLRISGSTTVGPVAADTADALRRNGLKITVDTQGGSAGGIAQLAAHQIDIAMISKPISAADRAANPGTDFVVTPIGGDAVGVVVRRAVAQAGVDDLTKAQVTALFQGDVSNWEQLGGPDVPVFVYDKEPGRGTREVLDKYLYGDATPPPPRGDHFAIVGGNEETRAKLISTPGSVGPLSTGFIEGYPDLVAVSIDGVAPTAPNVADGRYPLSRELSFVTDGPPQGDAKTFVDYVLGAGGQELVTRHHYLGLAQLRG
jgi:phosphate transport system substrate-binding protein